MVLAAAKRVESPLRLIYYVVWAWFNARPPFAKRMGLETAWRLDVRSVRDKKLAAIGCYLNGQSAPGGHPWPGYLPHGVVAPAQRADEVYFRAVSRERRERR
jgi:hypothetical protein